MNRKIWYFKMTDYLKQRSSGKIREIDQLIRRVPGAWRHAMQQKRFDDLSDLEPLQGRTTDGAEFAADISDETKEALRKIDANIREAEQKSGTVFVA
jgi:hypothetical protein